HGRSAMRAASCCAASRISGVCEGTDTASLMTLRTPSSPRRWMARSTAAAWPAITSWPGLLKLAGVTISAPDTSLQTFRMTSSSAPSTAAIEPTPAGTAACIRRPRSATSAAASRNGNAPAQTSAEYSPRLWPATCAGIGPPCARHTRHTATLAASNAGCVCSVLPSSSSGPFCESAQRSSPAPSEASSNASRTCGNSAASSASMPTDCEPWPGNTNAKWGRGEASLLVLSVMALSGARLITNHRRRPGKPAAERFQQQVLPALHAPGTHRGIQCQRHRTRRRVGVLVDGDDHLFHWHVEALGGGFDDAHVGGLEGFVHQRVERLHRNLEHLAPAHLDAHAMVLLVLEAHRNTDRVVQQVLVAAVGVQARGKDAGLVGGFEHHRARAVAEQHAGLALAPVDHAGEGFGAHDQRAFHLPGAHEVVGDAQRVHEAGARGV